MIFYDAHLHCRGNEAGGFFVGLEGVPVVAGTLDNRQVLALHRPEERYLGFHYVAAGELQEKFSHRLLKYHPRREKYSPAEVEASIRLNRPAAVMLDTLNEPYWQSGDYWRIARAFPEILFIFAHSGGYLIQDFIKICHFQPNIYIDFALTHTMLACYGRRPEGRRISTRRLSTVCMRRFAGGFCSLPTRRFSIRPGWSNITVIWMRWIC